MKRMIVVSALLLACVFLSAADAGEAKQTERWYERLMNGQKAGYFQVVWAPSTWEGKKTVHDTTRNVTTTVRNMVGRLDRFTTTTQIDLERSPEGTLWEQRFQVEEAGRIQVETLRWTGSGYDHSHSIVGEPEIEKHIALDAPVHVDAESFLGHLNRDGKLEKGQSYTLRLLNVRAARVDEHDLEVVGEEEIEDEHGAQLACMRIRETDPRTKASSTMWLDKEGAFVRIQDDSGGMIRRVSRSDAESMPRKPAEMRITTPAMPALDRIFSADRHLVDLYVQGDELRSLPEIPDSPWSRVVEKTGSDEDGWLLKLDLTAYDSEEKQATLPADPEAFADELEATVLMQSKDPKLVALAKGVIGDEKDIRTAAHKLVRYVYHTLTKSSPEVGQASALEIIESCQGDCSEHALLFVAMCRAVGIPARRCSGYVHIGSAWGSHAWAEIHTGQWIAADPTTGELGAGARYLFFGYSDDPDSHPGLISTRLRGRMRFVSTRIEEGEQAYDLTDPRHHRIYDPDAGRFVHVLAGLEARNVPSDWRVQLTGGRGMSISGDGFSAQLTAQGDQGYMIDSVRRSGGAINTRFGGASALLTTTGNPRRYMIFSRRRVMSLQVHGADSTTLAMLEKCLAPTFAEVPPAWPEKDTAPDDAATDDDADDEDK